MLDLDLGEEGSGRRRHGLGEGEMRGGYGEMRKGRKPLPAPPSPCHRYLTPGLPANSGN